MSRAGANLFELSITCSEPCEIADGQQTVHGSAAKQRTLFLAPGKHALRAGFSEGRTESKSIDAVAGGSGILSFSGPSSDQDEPVAAVEPEPKPEQPAEPDTKEKSSGWSPTVVWIGVGATVVAGGVTLWSGLDTVNNPGADKVKAECAKGDTSCALYEEGRSKQTRTNVLIGVTGGLALATGLVAALAVDWGKPSAQPGTDDGQSRAHFKPWFAWSHGPSLGARGNF